MEPSTLAFIFVSMTSSFHLPQGMLSAVCYVESHHQLHVLNIDDGNGSSLGVCQVKLATATMLGFNGDEAKLMRPKTNIFYASMYLAVQLERYNGDYYKAIAAYNTGTYKENKSGVAVNQSYVSKVVKAWREKR